MSSRRKDDLTDKARLQKRFLQYEKWLKQIRMNGKRVHADEDIDLPGPEYLSDEELTTREVFALLQCYVEFDEQPDTIIEASQTRPCTGFPETEHGLSERVNEIVEMSNEEIARLLSGKIKFKRPTTSRYRLTKVLDKTRGPDGSAAEGTDWTGWLAEEISFWVVMGYPPPRIAHSIWPEEVSAIENITDENGWRWFMRKLNEHLTGARESDGEPVFAKALPKGWEEVPGLLTNMAKCAMRNGLLIPKDKLPRLRRADTRTIRSALQEAGYKWESSRRGFGKWVGPYPRVTVQGDEQPQKL